MFHYIMDKSCRLLCICIYLLLCISKSICYLSGEIFKHSKVVFFLSFDLRFEVISKILLKGDPELHFCLDSYYKCEYQYVDIFQLILYFPNSFEQNKRPNSKE